MRSLLVEARKLNGQLLLAYLTSLALHFSTKTQHSKARLVENDNVNQDYGIKTRKSFFKRSTKSKQLFFTLFAHAKYTKKTT